MKNPAPHNAPLFEFHISKACRAKYQVDELLFAYSGNALIVNIAQALALAQSMNTARDAKRHPALAVSPAELNAMGLLDEILHVVAERYRRDLNPKAFEKAGVYLANKLKPEPLRFLLLSFTNDFPPLAVHRGQATPEQYLDGARAGYPHQSVSLEEILHLWLANSNPALKPYAELFEDSDLAQGTMYLSAIKELEKFFKTQPKFGPFGQSLFELLQAPSKNAPGSIADQLRYIQDNWTEIIPTELLEKVMRRVLMALGAISEERKARGFGPGPALVPDFRKMFLKPEAGGYPAYEPRQYSPDLHWMPNVVMLAKNTWVWLAQLSQRYGYDIHRLDQVPDAELRAIAEQGFTALWLIGVWERSQASRKIKRMCGNPEAIASAYSLYDYSIAGDLGGDPAYFNLKDRAWRHGIRLAVDMVPNHTGIYSKWVIEHPDWFIQSDHPPFPGYSFNGPDLSDDSTVGLFLEDGYWTRSDAAVVFKRHDRPNADVRYIYHGNDGTHMPWNDTAQLNFLLPQVREAVIQQILRVARYSSIIRFDAAMTLAKKHYHRLWFPAPGSGGDIPSRSWHGLTHHEFEKAFPEEFWRQVVDRVAAEVPDTLLLAEAFWLMEGYFVRSLGMHRVYNSAFMNMLYKEENAKYRQVLKNLLEFDPQILKRFVNFMNNPDEEPAVAQFGRDDKYFGVCTMMATLPGLPMFGHGQLEGFGEKYGMEYARPYWNEQPDQWLLQRHQREVFPLLRKRYLFSEVDNFLLYDVVDSHGHVQHDIFAYSNGYGNERALVVFNNRYSHAAGWIKQSVAFRPHPDDQSPVRRTLSQGLGLGSRDWCLFTDLTTGLNYIRSASELSNRGLYIELGAYKHHVFADFRTAPDDPAGDMARLAQYLAGRGVPDLDQAQWEIKLEYVLEVFARLLSLLAFRGFISLVRTGLKSEADREAFYAVFETQLAEFIAQSQKVVAGKLDRRGLIRWAQEQLRATIEFLGQDALQRLKGTRPGQRFLEAVDEEALSCSLRNDCGLKVFYSLLVMRSAFRVMDQKPARELFLERLRESLETTGLEEPEAYDLSLLVQILTDDPERIVEALEDLSKLRAFLERTEVLQYLHCHWHSDVYWFVRERLLGLLYWMFAVSVLEHGLTSDARAVAYRRKLIRWSGVAVRAVALAAQSGYDFNRFLDSLADQPAGD